MDWYIVFLLFAEPQNTHGESVLCETCQVLISANSALDAYDKGIIWATEHIQESEFQFVGVEHIHSIGEEPADGVELCGRFYESEDVWQRKSELIPEKNNVRAVMWEQNDVPIGEMMDTDQKNIVRRVFGKTDGS